MVVLNFEELASLERYLPLLERHTPAFARLVVVDNGSSDGSAAWLTSREGRAEAICFDANHGFAGGYMKALADIAADVYVLLNPDIEVTPGWLAPLLSVFEDPAVAVCQPKMRSTRRRDHLEYGGGSGGYIDLFGFPFCRGRLGSEEEDRGQYDDRVGVFWACGASFAVRADAFWRAGGLDEAFFANMEEIDLCWRLQRLGYRIVAEPASVVYHVGGQVNPYGSPGRLYLNHRNSLAMLVKNLPLRRLAWVLPLRLAADFGIILQWLLRLSPGRALAAVRGWMGFVKGLPHWWAGRKLAGEVRPGHRVGGIYPGSLLVQFARGKRSFAQLGWHPSFADP